MTTISKMRWRGNVYIASGFLSPFRPTGFKELTEQAENAFKNIKDSIKNKRGLK